MQQARQCNTSITHGATKPSNYWFPFHVCFMPKHKSIATPQFLFLFLCFEFFFYAPFFTFGFTSILYRAYKSEQRATGKHSYTVNTHTEFRFRFHRQSLYWGHTVYRIDRYDLMCLSLYACVDVLMCSAFGNESYDAHTTFNATMESNDKRLCYCVFVCPVAQTLQMEKIVMKKEEREENAPFLVCRGLCVVCEFCVCVY